MRCLALLLVASTSTGFVAPSGGVMRIGHPARLAHDVPGLVALPVPRSSSIMRTRRPVHMREPVDASAKTGGIVAALAACWVAAHLVPLLFSVPPAGALDIVDDDAIYLYPDQGPSQLTYAAALAVTFLSILPTPGMLGLGKGDDVYRGEEETKKKGFGFASLDDVIKTARGAEEADNGKDRGRGRGKRSGKGPKMMVSNEDAASKDWRPDLPTLAVGGESRAGAPRMMAGGERRSLQQRLEERLGKGVFQSLVIATGVLCYPLMAYGVLAKMAERGSVP